MHITIIHHYNSKLTEKLSFHLNKMPKLKVYSKYSGYNEYSYI